VLQYCTRVPLLRYGTVLHCQSFQSDLILAVLSVTLLHCLQPVFNVGIHSAGCCPFLAPYLGLSPRTGLHLHAGAAEHKHNQGSGLCTACGTWSILSRRDLTQGVSIPSADYLLAWLPFIHAALVDVSCCAGALHRRWSA
jgi:hypothetical protein